MSRVKRYCSHGVRFWSCYYCRNLYWSNYRRMERAKKGNLLGSRDSEILSGEHNDDKLHTLLLKEKIRLGI